MGMLPIAMALTLLLFLTSSGPMPSLIGQAAAQTSDALALQCRKAVFRKYGRSGQDPKKRYLNKNFVVREVDRCIANGGRVS